MNHDRQPAFRSYDREFSGPEGIAELRATGTRLSVADPSRFRMRVDSRGLARTRILEVRATPHRGIWDEGTQNQFGGAVTLFQIVLSGNAIGNIDGRTVVRTRGSLHVIRTGSAMHYVTDGPLHTAMLWVEHSLLSTPAIEAIRRVTADEFRDDTNARGTEAIMHSILHSRPTPVRRRRSNSRR